MNIEVKGINDVLLMKLNQDCSFESLLKELDMLLDQPIFQQEGFYPGAFFDFGCRVLEEKEIIELLTLLIEKKKVIFDGISIPFHRNQLMIQRQQLHNGDEIFIQNETLFLGVVNPGSFVYCNDNVYFLNTVKGTIVAMNEDVKIYGHDFQNAQIMINQKTLHDLTTSALSSIYYKDNEIKVMKEDSYEQNYCNHFR